MQVNYLSYFLNDYWFIPSDVLQRGIEARVWGRRRFKRPILEIGVGNGKVSAFIFKNIPRIDVGIDLNKDGLKDALKIKKYVKILKANAEKMPFKNASFNTVISNSTFEHIANDLQAISEVARVLKKNGLFFVTIPSEYLQKWILEYEKIKNKSKAQERLIKFNKRASHLHYRALNDWKKYFEKNDLKIISYKYYFPKKIALFWYKLFNKFTYRLGKREVWSIVGDSKLTRLLPKRLIINFLEKFFLKNAYKNGYFVNSGRGAQLFIIAKKI